MFLHNHVFNDYCRAPFHESNKITFRDDFRSKVYDIDTSAKEAHVTKVENNSREQVPIYIRPPFAIHYKSMSVDFSIEERQ